MENITKKQAYQQKHDTRGEYSAELAQKEELLEILNQLNHEERLALYDLLSFLAQNP